jgi:DNA-binding response OmpR family regulator
MNRVLVCDDERKIRETYYDYLTAKGFEVTLASNGREAVEMAEEDCFDIIVLDVMMPVMNGLEACRRIRSFSETPILFLSALGEENDLLSGYGLGCDDYIVKPFPLSVLVQKLNAIIARSNGAKLQNEFTCAGITVNKEKFLVTVDGAEISLANKTFRLLVLLMENKNIVLSREQILTKVWGWDFEGDERVVDTHIKKLRKSL